MKCSSDWSPSLGLQRNAELHDGGSVHSKIPVSYWLELYTANTN